MYSLLLVDLAYIYIYIYIYNSFKYPVRRQKLLDSARSGSSTLSYWNCVIIPGWWLRRAGYCTCFHTLYDEKIYISISKCSIFYIDHYLTILKHLVLHYLINELV